MSSVRLKEFYRRAKRKAEYLINFKSPKTGKAVRRRQFINQEMVKLAKEGGQIALRARLEKMIVKSGMWLRAPNQEGLDSMVAVLIALLDDIHLVAWSARVNLTNLADRCQLITKSKAGNVSISRAHRAIESLCMLGVITSPKAKFNPFDGHCETKDFVVRDSFFLLFGIAPKKALRERSKILGTPSYELVDHNDMRVLEAQNEIRRKKREASLKRMMDKRQRVAQARRESVFKHRQLSSAA